MKPGSLVKLREYMIQAQCYRDTTLATKNATIIHKYDNMLAVVLQKISSSYVLLFLYSKKYSGVGVMYDYHLELLCNEP